MSTRTVADVPTQWRSASQRRTNQHLPSVPDALLLPLIQRYHGYGWNDSAIAKAVLEEVQGAMHGWGLSAKTVKRRREGLGLLSVRQQGLNADTIGPYIEELRQAGYGAHTGIKRMQGWLRMKGVLASETAIAGYKRANYPQEVAQRKANRLKRKQFWTAGVFAVVAVDQHDKWKRHGICLHLGMELFSGALMWVRPWWTNSNPRLIFSFYLEMARKYKGIPLVTQSDPGSENNGIANGHTMLRQSLDPSLIGTSQHVWCGGHLNVRCEGKWSQLRREFTPGYEDVFAEGVRRGFYDRQDPLQWFIFRWLVIPFLREKLDEYVAMHNASKPRADRNKLLPIGVPEHIIRHPHLYKHARDFRVMVTEDDLAAVEQLYAPPDHPVFQLVPEAFELQISTLYAAGGFPAITLRSLWPVFLELRAVFMSSPTRDQILSNLASQVEVNMTIADEYMILAYQPDEEDSNVMYPAPGLHLESEERHEPVAGQLIPEVHDLLRPPLTQTAHAQHP